MHGLMQNMPLMITSLIRLAVHDPVDIEIVSRETTGGIHRYTYHDAHRRSRQLARALLSLGVKGINLGPNPPAFITPNVFKILQDKFDLRIIGKDAKQDLARVLQPA